jgi:hypothetical protein
LSEDCCQAFGNVSRIVGVGFRGEVVNDGGIKDLVDEVKIGVVVELSLITGLFKDRSYAQPVTLAVAIPVGL